MSTNGLPSLITALGCCCGSTVSCFPRDESPRQVRGRHSLTTTTNSWATPVDSAITFRTALTIPVSTESVRGRPLTITTAPSAVDASATVTRATTSVIANPAASAAAAASRWATLAVSAGAVDSVASIHGIGNPKERIVKMAPAPARYVVIGASGILAPLGGLLRDQNLIAIGVSRGSRLAAGSWTDRVALDMKDVPAVATWVAGHGADIAALIAYAPALAPRTWGLLAALTGRIVVVATSNWANQPGHVAPWSALRPVVLQLGWVRDGHNSRWHTPLEISTAVADVLAGGWEPRTVVLGTLSPVATRP